MLDYMHRQLGQLNVINDIPESDVPSQTLLNRALDVKTCSLNFLAIHIGLENNRLGLIGTSCIILTDLGNMGSAIFKADVFDAARRDLEKAVLEFNSALSDFGHSIGFITFKTVRGIHFYTLVLM
jgi:hypothetical protein